MKIAVVSDAHLSSDESVDNFGKDAMNKFIAFCDKLHKDKFDLLLLNGDWFELWQGKGWTERKRYILIRKRYSDIFDKFLDLSLSGMDVRYISGNHDFLLYRKYNVPLEHILKTEMGTFLFLHGHQFDRNYKSKLSWFKAKAATGFWGIVESIVGVKTANKYLGYIDKYISGVDIKAKKSAASMDKSINKIYAINAINYANKKGADFVIMGHTHDVFEYSKKVVPAFAPKGARKRTIYYYNTGTLTNGKTDWIMIDTKKKIIKIKSY